MKKLIKQGVNKRRTAIRNMQRFGRSETYLHYRSGHACYSGDMMIKVDFSYLWYIMLNFDKTKKIELSSKFVDVYIPQFFKKFRHANIDFVRRSTTYLRLPSGDEGVAELRCSNFGQEKCIDFCVITTFLKMPRTKSLKYNIILVLCSETSNSIMIILL
jgi:hypothetical protein